ncbi:MAG: hypothetical protein ABIG67_05805 [Pseudomonadota bacterium]
MKNLKIETYSELDKIDLTPKWIGNQSRGDGTEFALYNVGMHTVSIHTLWERGILPACECCNQRTAAYENGLCSFCEKERGKE